MAIVAEEAATARGLPFDEAKTKAMGTMIVKGYDKQSTALFATARLWDDGLIDPRDSRATLPSASRPARRATRARCVPNVRRGEVLRMALVRTRNVGRSLVLNLADPSGRTRVAEMVAGVEQASHGG